MKESMLKILVDPATRMPLQLVAKEKDGAGEVMSGELVSKSGSHYAITGGIPRFTAPEKNGQEQTVDSFGYKWTNTDAYEFDYYKDFIEKDEVPRWGLNSADDFTNIFRNKRRILDAGCGSAHFASIYVPHAVKGGEWVGTDLTPGAIDIARKRLGSVQGTNFVNGDLLNLPYADSSFDFILCRGVMHHTPSTYEAFKSLVRVLEPGGEFMFLIYRKMGPIREFTDDFIRAHLSKLPAKEGWKALESLTKLGKALSELNVQVDVPEDIPYLEIPKGRHDIQRLFYYHFVKAYWNADLDFETNQHNTFDWYHPQFATHHTKQEIEGWCAKHGLKITFIKDMETSWAVRCIKN